jgi:hypothetical protein
MCWVSTSSTRVPPRRRSNATTCADKNHGVYGARTLNCIICDASDTAQYTHDTCNRKSNDEEKLPGHKARGRRTRCTTKRHSTVHTMASSALRRTRSMSTARMWPDCFRDSSPTRVLSTTKRFCMHCVTELAAPLFSRRAPPLKPT